MKLVKLAMHDSMNCMKRVDHTYETCEACEMCAWNTNKCVKRAEHAKIDARSCCVCDCHQLPKQFKFCFPFSSTHTFYYMRYALTGSDLWLQRWQGPICLWKETACRYRLWKETFASMRKVQLTIIRPMYATCHMSYIPSVLWLSLTCGCKGDKIPSVFEKRLLVATDSEKRLLHPWEWFSWSSAIQTHRNTVGTVFAAKKAHSIGWLRLGKKATTEPGEIAMEPKLPIPEVTRPEVPTSTWLTVSTSTGNFYYIMLFHDNGFNLVTRFVMMTVSMYYHGICSVFVLPTVLLYFCAHVCAHITRHSARRENFGKLRWNCPVRPVQMSHWNNKTAHQNSTPTVQDEVLPWRLKFMCLMAN